MRTPPISDNIPAINIDIMYIVLNRFLDIPVVSNIDSVSADIPTDCPGNPKIIKKQDIANATNLPMFVITISVSKKSFVSEQTSIKF